MKKAKPEVLKIRLIGVLVLIMGIVYIVRLYNLQVSRGEEFYMQANRQYSATPGTLYERGSIYFTDKDGNPHAAATLASGFTIAINPSLLENASSTFEALSKHIELDPKDFMMRASKTEDPYEEVVHQVSQEAADAIRELDIEGVQAYRQQWRYYPGDELASHVLGFVGSDGEHGLDGRYGIERGHEKVLRRAESDVYSNFFAEILGGAGELIFDQEEGRAGDIYLTIEPRVQSFIEDTITELKDEWSAKEVGAIVMDPETGEIFAMAAAPNFNPNSFSVEESIDVFSNPLVERVYEMGSIVKPLTMAAGLDARVVNAATKYTDLGFVESDGFRIENYDGEARGKVDMQEVLNQSLNTGAVFVETHLGNDRFRDYMLRYGIADITGIDLPSEAGGLTDNLNSKKNIEYYTASFGQGIAVTPITMARALAVLANGGYLIKPHVVKKVDYDLGFSEETKPTEQGVVISRGTSDEITRMLVKVVDDALRGGTVKIDRYSIAAKTGTAQIASPEGGYYEDRFLHSFFGYFPAYEPRFLIFLYHVEPIGARYASETLTTPFMDTVKFLTSYYDIPPDR